MPVVDLFCGCGGLSRGFELAGFDIVAAFDGWPAAVACYNANFQHDAYELDLSDVDNAVNEIRQYAPTVIIGGPPCQEFSNAGCRKEGAKADLTYKYAQIVTRILPDYFVMENVPRAKDSKAYAKARALYLEHGYSLTEIVLDACRCGVPQKRKRFFCIGAQHAEPDFLQERLCYGYGDEETVIRDYFEAQGIQLDINNYYRHPTTYTRRAIFPVSKPSPTIRGVNRPKPETYRRHEKDSVGEDELENVRSLSLRERATIQTFPEDFRFEGLNLSNGDLEQMVGNAVPVLLAQFVAAQLSNHINGVGIPMDERHEFEQWLHDVRGYASYRSINDVFSRLRRAERLLPNRTIDRYFLADLEQVPEFETLKVSVKSQIRKAINLKIAFLNRDNQHE